MNTSLLSAIGDEALGTGLKQEDQAKLIKKFSQDKVIRSITSLTEKNEAEIKKLNEERKKLQIESKEMGS